MVIDYEYFYFIFIFFSIGLNRLLQLLIIFPINLNSMLIQNIIFSFQNIYNEINLLHSSEFHAIFNSNHKWVLLASEDKLKEEKFKEILKNKYIDLAVNVIKEENNWDYFDIMESICNKIDYIEPILLVSCHIRKFADKKTHSLLLNIFKNFNQICKNKELSQIFRFLSILEKVCYSTSDHFIKLFKNQELQARK